MSEYWVRFEDAASCDMFPEMTFYVFPELIKADEGFLVKGGRKIVANRWEDANGETGILV